MADRFEVRLDRLFRDYADLGVRGVDHHVIAAAAIATRPARSLPAWWVRRGAWGRRLVLGVVVALVVVATGAVLIGGSPNERAPVLPSATPQVTSPASAAPSPSRAVRAGGAIIIPATEPGAATRFLAYAADGTSSGLDLPAAGRSCPTFSPDGRSLAFIGTAPHPGSAIDETLVIANPDGTDQQIQWRGHFNLQTFHQVVWSPNSAYAAATHASTDTGESVIIGRRSGGTAIVFPHGGGEFTTSLAFSPDGSQLAVIVPTYESGAEVPTGWAIDIRDVAGPASRRIATAPRITSVAWSPDGATIAYVAGATADFASVGDLFFIDLPGGAPRPIDEGSAAGYSSPTWSPDGRLLAAITSGGDDPADTFSVTILERDGTVQRRLGGFPVTGNLFITWSPDSAALLLSFGGDQSGAEPGIVPIDGGPIQYLDVPEGGYYTQCPLTWQAAP